MLSKNQYRLLSLSRKYNISHLGSNLTALPILEGIYRDKGENDIVTLGAGHYGLALYTVLEAHYGFNAEKLWLDYGTHPRRDLKRKIYCSSGSLGLATSISVGLALSDRSRKVFNLSSDGELYEGICFEALTIKRDFKLDNLIWLANFNGFSAVQETRKPFLMQIYGGDVFLIETRHLFAQFPFLDGIHAHYKILDNQDWEWVEENKPV